MRFCKKIKIRKKVVVLDKKIKLLKAFNDTLFVAPIDMGIDYSEIAIDSFLKDGFLKELPIVKTLIGTGKAICAIRDLHFFKKTLHFTLEMRNGTIDNKQLIEHNMVLNNNSKNFYREMETVLILLERENDSKKSEILARFYKRYIDVNIQFTWDDFCFFGEILESVSLFDLDSLKMLYKLNFIKRDANENINYLSLSRLNALGLINYFGAIPVKTQENIEIIAQINQVGKYFTKYGLL